MRSGAVPPHFLSYDDGSLSGFNKRFKNFSLKLGIVIKKHNPKAKTNLSKNSIEYDILVSENNANADSSFITYRNCQVMELLGGIGDFSEKTFRVQSKKKTKLDGYDANNQDGSQVLLLCLNGSSERAIIIGALKHPDRKTKLTGDGNQYFSSFNGVDFKIEDDGSCKLTFNGATDSEGVAKDKTQGVTFLEIEKDGSLQITGNNFSMRLQKDGKSFVELQDLFSLKSKKSVSFTSEDKDSGNKASLSLDNGKILGSGTGFDLSISGSASMSFGELKASIQGSATIKTQSLNVDAASIIKIKSSNMTLDSNVSIGGAGGAPAVIRSTEFFGTDGEGAPVRSLAIGPFSRKVRIV
jgi:phage gp45-like